MSESNGYGFASRGTTVRAGLALATAVAAMALPGSAEAAAADLERAYVDRVAGVAPSLRRDTGTVRVRVTAARQPLLRAAIGGSAERLLQPRSSRVGSALEIDDRERRSARRAERSYEAGLSELSRAADSGLRRLRSLAALVRARGGRIEQFDLASGSVIARIDSTEIERLSGFAAVAAVDPAPRQRRLSGIGTGAVGAPAWWAAGFTGGTGASDTVPADAAVESEAADPTHPAFSGATIDNDPTQAVSDHGTHTGGVIASGDSTYPGVAPGIDRLIGSSNETYAMGLPPGSGATDPAETLNISFGSKATTDDTDNAADVLTAVFGIGQAFGAGNENIDGSPTVGNIGRNVLTVGGFNDVGTVTSTDDVVLGISSRGPTPGGRKKPDLTAPAGAVIAPSSAWNSPPSNPDFTAMTGTSFAAPHVAGAMTLLEGAGIADAKAQRAILINSARDWNGAATGLAGWAPPQIGWRPEVGWGELDLATALAHRSDYQLGAVPAGEATYYSATAPGGGKATLAYELRGYFVGFPNPGTQTFAYTQSNLDLHQYLADGTEVMPPAAPPHGGGPDAIDPNDTVEQVRAPVGPSQPVIYKVEAASTVEGASAEPFALAAAGPLDHLQAAVVRPTDLETAPSGPVPCGAEITVSAAFANDSEDLTAAGATGAIDLPPGLSLVAGDTAQDVSDGELDPGETSEQHSWTVEATSDGTKQMTIAGTGGALGTDFTRTGQTEVVVDCIPPNTSIDSGPSGTTNAPVPGFTFSGAAGATAFECSVDDGPYSQCGSPTNLPGLGEGEHRFSVRARDAAGNVDPSPAGRTFVIDRSVAGASTAVGSSRIARSGRRLGSLRVALGEAGDVAVSSRGSARGRPIEIAPAALRFSRAGSATVPLRVDRSDRRLVRHTKRRDGRIVIRVMATFEDEHGNVERAQRLRFAAR
ncbi:MAG: S8 family serine peptidase [Solirubrobacterales bacterium]